MEPGGIYVPTPVLKWLSDTCTTALRDAKLTPENPEIP